VNFASGIVLARVDALPDPCAVVVTPDPDLPYATILVTRAGERISAFRNKCPHAGYPLQRADGRVMVQEGRYMVCAAHGASYTLEDGACAGGPCNGDALERVEIVLRNGEVVTR
jgi:nitrite reductase/ring-hydroxylating ferredoxin subunit